MNAGGAETFLMKIYRAIDRKKYQFDFCINLKDKGFYDDEIESLGGRIYHIPSKSESLSRFKKELSRIVIDNKYKYVLRITANAAGLLDLKIAKEAGALVCIARSSNSNTEGGIKSKVAHKIGQLLYLHYVDIKIAPSILAGEYTFGKKAVASGKVTILHNALATEIYKYNEKDRVRIRKELGVDDKELIVGHIGRFMEQKNHAKLIEIFTEIQKARPNSLLLLIGGNGNLEAKIRELVHVYGLDHNVIFMGIRSDVSSLLSAIDVFVMPSLYEGMPNTVIEAQATGLPCVISSTITKEADITGLVKYCSLDATPKQWADIVISSVQNERRDTTVDFIEKGYNIEFVVKFFCEIVFGEKK